MADKPIDGLGAPPTSATSLKVANPIADPDWNALLETAKAKPIVPVTAQTFHLGPWSSASRPVCVKCSDGIFRVLKGKQAGGRMLFNDQVIARLAQKIGAPVPEPAIVDLPKALIDAEPKLQHMPEGLCHGSAFQDAHSDRQGVAHHSLAENRRRFSLLAVLYGWMFASDHQQIYPNTAPHLVVSVDHGHFVGDGGPNWTPVLLSQRPAAQPDGVIVAGASLTRADLEAAIRSLDVISPQDVAEAVAAPPDEWGVPIAERILFTAYVWKRRSELIAMYPPPAINDSQAQGA